MPSNSNSNSNSNSFCHLLSGFGCDTSAVINILAHRDATQRAYLQQEYRATYSEDLLKRLSSELSGKLENAILLWMHDPATRDAIILKQTLTVSKNLEATTEVICSRTPSQLQYLRQIYHTRFGVYLDHDIERNASGDHKKVRILLSLLVMLYIYLFMSKHCPDFTCICKHATP
jgi:annexin D